MLDLGCLGQLGTVLGYKRPVVGTVEKAGHPDILVGGVVVADSHYYEILAKIPNKRL